MLFWIAMGRHYHVDAVWDPEAAVWVAGSDDVPGLATEADTLEELTKKLRILIPELLTENGVSTGAEEETISFELTGHRHELVTLAS
jgi:predicted RNase H-like HicB family nuclease